MRSERSSLIGRCEASMTQCHVQSKMADGGKPNRLMARKAVVEAMKEKAKAFTTDRKNSNNIIDILACLESDDVNDLLPALRAIQKVFLHVLKHGMMYADESEESPEHKYRFWLRERYRDTKIRLLDLMYFKNKTVQELCLCILMKFLSLEGSKPLQKVQPGVHYFPVSFFQDIVHRLLSDDVSMRVLTTRFQEFVMYDDVKYQLLRILCSTLKTRRKTEVSKVFLCNFLDLLEHICLSSPNPKSAKSNANQESYALCFLDGTTPSESFQLDYALSKKMFSSIWVDFLTFKLPTALYKRVLIVLHDKVLPHLDDPLVLTDFLIDSYNVGGVISLLALNSLFALMQRYNLEYPEFYKKLYSLFNMDVLHVKYKARFFYLADRFLSSTHLPEYLVAAFVKKLARLALVAPPNVLVLLLPFLRNLLIRHPNLSQLMHSQSEPEDFASDPFIMDESDPAKCRAVESSLWEIRTLQLHYVPEVQISARFINKTLPTIENDLSDLYERTVDEMIEKETQRNINELHLNLNDPLGLFQQNEEKLSKFWCI